MWAGLSVPLGCHFSLEMLQTLLVVSFVGLLLLAREAVKLRSQLAGHELRLREIHHRFKNNLQMISSFLQLQESRVQDPRDALLWKESRNRIRSMAMIHEKLYRSDNTGDLPFADYIRDLTSHLLSSYSISTTAVELDVQAGSIPMSLDKAVPCGLILNELITNALRHAFPGDAKGVSSSTLSVSRMVACR